MELKEVPENITLDNYCIHFKEFDAISFETTANLQKQLVMRLTEKEKKDFFNYLYKVNHNYAHKTIRRPNVWMKIYNCLPLIELFVVFIDNQILNKLKKRKTSTIDFPFSKEIIYDEVNSKENWNFNDYYFYYKNKKEEPNV